MNAKILQLALERIARTNGPVGVMQSIASKALHDAQYGPGVAPQPLPEFTVGQTGGEGLDTLDKFRTVQLWFWRGHSYARTKTMLRAIQKHHTGSAGEVEFSSDYRRVIVRGEIGGHSMLITTYDVHYGERVANVMIR